MTVHHIINSEHQRNICPYCKKELPEKWKSEFPGNRHYKKIECSCGRKIMIEADFIGSGDDSFNRRNEHQAKLDEKIERFEKEIKGKNKG